MTDRLLNLVSELQDENWRYDVNLMFFDGEGFDYVLTCRCFYETGTGSPIFDVDPFLRHQDEFAQFSIDAHSRDEGPWNFKGVTESVSQHVVEIRVKE